MHIVVTDVPGLAWALVYLFWDRYGLHYNEDVKDKIYNIYALDWNYKQNFKFIGAVVSEFSEEDEED